MAWVEIVADRTQKTKHYYDADTGKHRLEATIADRHYNDGSAWQDVDESFVNETGTFAHQCLTVRHHIHIGTNSQKRWMPRRLVPTEYIHFGRLQYWTGTAWSNLNLGTPVRAGNVLTWNTTNFTLQLINNWHRVKILAVLKNANAAKRLRWAVTLNGLTWNNWTLVSNSDSVVVGTIDAPKAWDANGSEMNPNIIITPSYSGGYVEFSGDLSGAVYPVTIDPTFTDGYGGDVDTAKDTHIANYAPDDNHGTDDNLMMYSMGANIYRNTFIEFDVSLLAGKTVTGTTLTVHELEGYIDGDASIVPSRILDANDWVESELTWNHRKTGGHWAGDVGEDGGSDAGCSVSGTDYDTTNAANAIAFSGVDGTERVFVFTAAGIADVQYQIDIANNGFIIHNTSSFGYCRIASSDNETASYRPKLMVEYEEGGATATGTLDVTLAGYTLSGTAQNISTGSLAKTFINATLTSAGVIAINGVLDKTLADATLISSGSIPSAGTLDATLASATLISTGAIPAAGSLSKSLADFSLISAASAISTGTLDKTLAGATLIASGSVPIAGSLIKTLADAILSANGMVTSGPAISGDLAVTLANATLASVGTSIIGGSFDSTLANFTLVSAGISIITGALDKTFANATLTANASVSWGAPIIGTLDITLANATLVATGLYTTPERTGAMVATLANATFISSGASIITGQANITAGAFTLSATGTQEAKAELASTLQDATVVSQGFGLAYTIGQMTVILAGANMYAWGVVGKPHQGHYRPKKHVMNIIARNTIVYRRKKW